MSALDIVDLSVDDNSNEAFKSKDYVHLNSNTNNVNMNGFENSHQEVFTTIDLEESPQTFESNRSGELIEISLTPLFPIEPDKQVTQRSSVDDSEVFNKLYLENKLFAELIETCLNFKSAPGMLRVVTKTLIPLFNCVDSDFRKSEAFNSLVSKTLNKVEVEADHKFTHLKNLCESLKENLKWKKQKKKVALVTLATNLKETSSNKEPVNNISKDNDIIIDLDSEEPSIIDLDEYQHDVILLDDKIEEKENKSSQEDNTLLVPVPESSDDKASKIKAIEEKIKFLKKAIIELNEKEVNCDDHNSPYIISENYKAAIVEWYKKLCELTGEPVVRRREVKLKVKEGYPAGPVKILEQFLNDNITGGGHPPFPDFLDVVQCVESANIRDGLGWRKTQVMEEARRLFTMCGRALQKRRRKREWKDLISKVKKKEIIDPADNDSELQYKLELNRRIALKREKAVFNKFSDIQHLAPPAKRSITGIAETAIFGTDNNKHSFDIDREKNKEEYAPGNLVNNNMSNVMDPKETGGSPGINETDCQDKGHAQSKALPVLLKIKKEPEDDLVPILEDFGNNYTATVADIEDPFFIVEVSDSSEESDVEEPFRNCTQTDNF